MSVSTATSRQDALATVGDRVAEVAFRHPWQRRWLLALAGASALLGLLIVCLIALYYYGVGVWGNNIPVTWALDIVGYDWWIGIACGGLIVSAFMLLAEEPERGALNRIAETVALFATAAAAIYPIIHLGRSWFFYWTIPYPNRLDLWPQFRSPLVWDAMDIISLLGITLCFWITGMLPDLAMLRDRAQGYWQPRLYGLAALGWRGSARHWECWRQAHRLQALFALAVVVSLQAGAAVMFAGTVEPGWHDTLLPVFFLTMATYSGIAGMTLAAVAIRYNFDLPALITRRHLDILGWMMLAAGLAATYCYMIDFFNTAYGGDRYDLAVMARRATGIYGWSFWFVVGCALLPIHLLWIGPLRRSPKVLAVVASLILVGAWMDHFMLIVITLHRDFLPSSEHFYSTSFWSVGTFLGTMGLFAFLLLLFLRYLPVVSVVEMRRTLAARGAAE